MIRMLPKYYDYQKCCKKCKCKAVGLHSTVRLCNPVVNTKNTASSFDSKLAASFETNDHENFCLHFLLPSDPKRMAPPFHG